jgi:cysteine sulfinate desulfinase/cysteine desulfurase-like protein
MGLSREEALSSLRVSFGAGNTPGDAAAFFAALVEETRALRAEWKERRL